MKKSAAGLVAGYFNFTHLDAAETKILVDDLGISTYIRWQIKRL
jgi:hypothetical protein